VSRSETLDFPYADFPNVGDSLNYGVRFTGHLNFQEGTPEEEICLKINYDEEFTGARFYLGHED
jgi:hypothetical protein